MPLFWKLFALVAVLLMPLGMAGAPAHAQHHQAMAGMAMDHCPDQDQEHGMASGVADCTMACAAALPAGDLPDALPNAFKAQPESLAIAERLHGLHPETAKPPPRFS